MALTQTQVSELYVSIFNRASEGSGNRFWQQTDLSAAETANQMLATQDSQNYFGSSLDTNQAFIEHIYLNTLNKTVQDDPDGIAYWVDLLDNGASRGDVVVGLVEAVATYENATDPLTKAAYEQFTNRVAVSDFMATQVDATPANYAKATSFGADIVVTDNQQTVIDAMQRVAEIKSDTEIHAEINNVLTLQKVVDETVNVTTDSVATTYWGEPGNQITIDQFYEMVKTVTGQDLFELTGGINIDAAAALTDVNVVQDAPLGDGSQGPATITYTTATGEQFTSELALGQEYIALLDSLIYYIDADGNKVSRFHTESQDVITHDSSFALAPIVLTTTVNNGSTSETGFTSAENDLIFAGQTELLHGAYIDGGAGVNTLEVIMKGVYAQPIELLNIQNVLVENLPNVYDDYYDLTDDSHADGVNIPDYLDLNTANAALTEATANLNNINNILAADIATVTTAQTAVTNAQTAVTTQEIVVATAEGTQASAQTTYSNDSTGANLTALANADAALATANATLATLQGTLTSAEATLAAAQANLSANETLLNLDAATLAYSTAQANVTQATNIINSDSILDLSNAREIENLVVTEGRNTGNDQQIGDLTIVGVRGNATTTLEGMFTADNVNIFYSEGLADGVNLTLNLGDVDNTTFGIFHNSNTININSIGGGNVLAHANFGDATLMNMNISGTAEFVVSDSIADNFTAGHPADIDAHTNTAGVDITMDGFNDEVVFTGTAEADDHFNANSNGKSVAIAGGNGNNEFVANNGKIVNITSGSGNDEISANDATTSVTIDAGAGVNTIDASGTHSEAIPVVNITSTEGNDTITAKNVNDLTIDAGDGNNIIDSDGSTTVSITTGTGDDSISAVNVANATIDAGDGNNTIVAYSDVINITTGAGDDVVSIDGSGSSVGNSSSNTALINIDLGTGSNTLVVGVPNEGDEGLTALAGSTITGSDITLSVGITSDLSQVTDLSAVTAVNLEHDTDLRITADQFIAIGAENFSVDGQAFGNTATLTIVTDHSRNFDELNITDDTFACDNIDLNIDLACDNPNENVFTLTAEQLDTYIAPDGITVDTTSNYDNNQVIITDAGLDFDAFDATYGGGSIDDSVGTQDVTIHRALTADDGYERPTEDNLSDTLTISSDTTPDVGTVSSTQVNTVNIDGAADFTGKFNLAEGFTVDFSALTGAEDITISNFQGVAANMVSNSSTIAFNLGGTLSQNGTITSTVPYTLNGQASQLIVETSFSTTDNLIDVVAADVAEALNGVYGIESSVTGSLVNATPDTGASLTIGAVTSVNSSGDNPTNTVVNGAPTIDANDVPLWGEVIGNGDARVNVEVADGSQTGYNDITQGGFISSGVSTYVVTDILAADGTVNSQAAVDSATIYVCDQTADLAVLGLQNNRNSTVTFENVNWGTEILLEGDGYENASQQLKNFGDPDLSEVGAVVANFFEAGENAVVKITNQGQTLGMNEDAEDGIDANGERVLDVAGITITNADRLAINVEDGDAVINTLSAAGVEVITVTGPEDVTVPFEDAAFDANGSNVSIIDASGVDGTFTLLVTDDSDLSDVTLSGIDALVIDSDAATLTLSADEVTVLGALISDANDDSTLDVNGLDGTHTFDLSTIDVSNIGTVTTADVDGTIVLATPSLGGADALIINAMTSDTTLQMTMDQYNTYCGSTNEAGTANIGCNATGTNEATLMLTDVAADESIDLSNVDRDEDSSTDELDAVDVVIQIADITATADFEITDTTAPADDEGTITLELSGNVDLTKASLNGLVDAVNIADGAVVTMTAAQAVAIGFTDADGDGVADAWSGTGTLNIVDLAGDDTSTTGTDEGQNVDLDLVAAAGITIGTVSIANNDTENVLNATVTFGGATEIITPTKEADEGSEDTSVTMTVAQFLSSAGVISGDSQINLTGLTNNVDTDADYTDESANYDFSQIANAGTLTLSDNTITLVDAANLGDFTIALGDGQLIRFANEGQAAADISAASSTTTGVQWMWTTYGAAVDTSGYDADITTLFIDEGLLVSQPVEENLWTSLDGHTVVEKINGDTIPQLTKYNRTNTFEALANITAGVNYDNTDGFETAATLTMNLEGEVNIASVLVGDTQNGDGSTPNIDGQGYLTALTINSYLDTTTIEGYDATATNGIALTNNTIGDISLNAGSVDNLVNVTINTYADADGTLQAGDPVTGSTTSDGGFYDAENVNGAVAERDGLAIEVGTITFASVDADTTAATLTLTGAEDITITDTVMDASLSMLTINMANSTAAVVSIGGIDYTEFDHDGDAATAGIDYDTVIMLQNYAGDDAIGTGGADLIEVVGGTVDLTAATLTAEDLYVAGDATVTMTAAQIIAIGEDNFTLATGANVTLNVTDLTTAAIDLNAIQDAGFDIGTVTTTVDTSIDVADATTFGGADEVQVLMDSAAASLRLSAEQYSQITAGNITQNDTDATVANVAAVTVYGLEAMEAADGTVTIDLSTVATTGAKMLEVSDAGTAVNVLATATPGDQDVKLNDASNLGDFGVTLYDIVSTATVDELAGETIRFANETQAGRLVEVDNTSFAANSSVKGEQDTNVVWMFDTTTAAIETTYEAGVQGYDPELGRLWVREDLVDGGNVESFYTTLAGDIIVRVENTNLTEQLAMTQPINRDVEITSFTSTASLEFTDDDLLEHVYDLNISMGGETNIGNLALDNILAPVDPLFPNFPGDDEFGTLTINSLVADSASHYLLPDDFDPATDVLPNDPAYGYDGTNIIGDITSGPSRGELATVVVNTGTGTTSAALEVQTIYFADDTGDDPLATFTAGGASNVTVKSLDTSDPEITALTVTNGLTAGHTLTVTGGSPAFDGGDATGDTEVLTIASGAAGTFTTFGSAIDPADATAGVYAGVSGADLSVLTITQSGTVNLGTVARVDSDDFALTAADAAVVSMTLGTADANGVTAPTLNAGGTWSFAGVDSLTIEDSVTLGAGNLVITSPTSNHTIITIDGNVDFSTLAADDTTTTPAVEGLLVTNDVTVILDNGNTLQMTDEQWTTNTANMTFTDALGAPAVLEVTADLIAEIGSDLTQVRGYAAYDIDAGLSVTLREDQADAAYVDGDFANLGTLTGADVTVFVQEVGFGDNNISNLTGVDVLVLEQDVTDSTIDDPDLIQTYGYDVTMTVEQADSLVGNITKNGNTVTATVDAADDGVPDDLTDPAGDGSVPAYDLSEVDLLVMSDPTTMNLTQYGVPAITLAGNALTLKASGDLTAVEFDDSGATTPTGHTVTNLVLTGDTTVLASQEAALAGTVTMETPATDTHTLTINNVELLGADTAPVDGFIDANSIINLDLSNVTVATVNANMNTMTTDPIDGVTPIDGNYTLTGDLNGATLALSGAGTVTADVAVVDTETVTGTTATLNMTVAGTSLDDSTNANNNDAFDFSNVAAAIAGTLTLNNDDVELDPNTNLGDFTTVVADNKTLIITTAQANGKDITDADGAALGVSGHVSVTDLGETAVDLTGVIASGIKNVYLSSTDADGIVVLDGATDLGDFNIVSADHIGSINDYNSIVTDLTLSAAQANGKTFTDSNTKVTDITITALEDALGADLQGIDEADVNVQLDSTGNVQLLAGADLTGINTGTAATPASQVTVSGNGIVTFADESGVGVGDSADVNDTNFILESGATLQTDLRHDDADSIVTISRVSGDGELQIVADNASVFTITHDVQYTETIITGTDAGITIDGFTAGVFTYAGNPTGVQSLNLNEAVVDGTDITKVDYQEDDITAGAGAITMADGMTVVTDAGGNTAAHLTETSVAAFLANVDGAAGSSFAFDNADNVAYIAVTDGTNTGIYLADDQNGDTVIDAADLTLVVTLNGIDNPTDFISANFDDFA